MAQSDAASQTRPRVGRPNLILFFVDECRADALGTGRLDDNLFPLDSVKLASLPKLAREAKAKANIPEGVVARILLKRNLPETTDIKFRVFVSSQRRDATLDADQTGRLID